MRFYSQAEAAEQARKRRTRQKDDGPPIHYYQCRFEGLGRHWHIGHESAKYSEKGNQCPEE